MGKSAIFLFITASIALKSRQSFPQSHKCG